MLRNFKIGPVPGKPGGKIEYDWAAEEAALRELEELTSEDLDQAGYKLTFANEETLQEVAEQTSYGTIFLDDLIKRQRALSLSVAITFLMVIFSFPLLNFFLPSLVAFEIFNFQISWLFLAILIYPLIWALAFYFVTTADKYEEEFTRLVK